jgi:hypothetical protein
MFCLFTMFSLSPTLESDITHSCTIILSPAVLPPSPEVFNEVFYKFLNMVSTEIVFDLRLPTYIKSRESYFTALFDLQHIFVWNYSQIAGNLNQIRVARPSAETNVHLAWEGFNGRDWIASSHRIACAIRSSYRVWGISYTTAEITADSESRYCIDFSIQNATSLGKKVISLYTADRLLSLL